MHLESTIEQLFQHLVSGDRRRVQAFVASLAGTGVPAERIANDVYWPIHEMLVKLFKHGQLSRVFQGHPYTFSPAVPGVLYVLVFTSIT